MFELKVNKFYKIIYIVSSLCFINQSFALTIDNNKDIKHCMLYSDQSKKTCKTPQDKIKGCIERVYCSYTKNLLYETPFVNGKENGIDKEYYSDGTLKRQSMYKDGNINGLVMLYHKNGALKEVYNLKNSIKDGAYYIYTDKGLLIESGLFKKDILDGVIYTYNEDGSIKAHVLYKDGKMQKR